MLIIFDQTASTRPTTAFVFDYTQYDVNGHQISEPTYPNPYAKVLIHAVNSDAAQRIFKARFPRSIIWNVQYA